MPVTDLVERDRPLRGQREMLLPGFAHIGIPFHHDESSPRLGAEIARRKPSTVANQNAPPYTTNATGADAHDRRPAR